MIEHIIRRRGQQTRVISDQLRPDGRMLRVQTSGERRYVVIAGDVVVRQAECATYREALSVLQPGPGETLWVMVQS